VSLGRRKVELLTIQLEDPLPFPGQQLAIRAWHGIPEHEVGLPIGPTVDIFKRSRSQNAPHGVWVPTMNKRVSHERAPLTKQRGLPLELLADIAVQSPGHPK